MLVAYGEPPINFPLNLLCFDSHGIQLAGQSDDDATNLLLPLA